MIKAKALPVILGVVSKIDARPIISRLKGVNLKSLEGGKLSQEDLALLGTEILAEILPQLSNIKDDVVPLIAAVKDIPLSEAEELDAIQALSDLFSDEALVGFFKKSLMKNRAQ